MHNACGHTKQWTRRTVWRRGAKHFNNIIYSQNEKNLNKNQNE